MIDPGALGLAAFLVMAGTAALRGRRDSTEAATYYIHDTPTGKAVVALTLGEAAIRRRAGQHLLGPYLTFADADLRLFDPMTYLPPKESA